MKTIPPKVRFWKFVDVRGDDDCWLWTGTLVKQDYGRFYLAAGKSAELKYEYHPNHGMRQ